MSLVDHAFELCIGPGQSFQDFAGDPSAFRGFDAVAGLAVDLEQIFDVRAGTIAQSGVIGQDHIAYVLARGGVTKEPGAAADVGDDANAAEGKRFELSDSKRLIDALPELDVRAPSDVHELHVFGHSPSATFLVETELVEEHPFDVTASGVEPLNRGIELRLATGEVGPASRWATGQP